MRESYACGLKGPKDIDLAHQIKDNFSRLTHKSGQIVLNTWWLCVLFCVLTKSYQSTLKVSSFKWLRKCSNVFENFFGHLIFGNVRKSSEIIENLRKSPGSFRKYRSWQGENLTHLTQKKLPGIILRRRRKKTRGRDGADVRRPGAGMAQWWEHSPSTYVARVRFPDSTSYVGWVCCWFSSLLREVFLRVLRFSPLRKNQHF